MHQWRQLLHTHAVVPPTRRNRVPDIVISCRSIDTHLETVSHFLMFSVLMRHHFLPVSPEDRQPHHTVEHQCKQMAQKRLTRRIQSAEKRSPSSWVQQTNCRFNQVVFSVVTSTFRDLSFVTVEQLHTCKIPLFSCWFIIQFGACCRIGSACQAWHFVTYKTDGKTLDTGILSI